MTDANTPSKTHRHPTTITPTNGLPSQRLTQTYQSLKQRGVNVTRSRTHIDSSMNIEDAFSLPADCLVVQASSREEVQLIEELTEKNELYADFEGGFDHQSKEYHSTRANINRAGVRATYVLQPLEAL